MSKWADPRKHSTQAPPAGSVPGQRRDDLVKNGIIVEGVGSQGLLSGRLGSDELLARVFLSLVGRVNRTTDEIHHAYLCTPAMAGLIKAQIDDALSKLPAEAKAEADAEYRARLRELWS